MSLFVGMTPFVNLKMLLLIYLETAISGLVLSLNEPHSSSPSALAKVSTIRSQIAAFIVADKPSVTHLCSNQSTPTHRYSVGSIDGSHIAALKSQRSHRTCVSPDLFNHTYCIKMGKKRSKQRPKVLAVAPVVQTSQLDDLKIPIWKVLLDQRFGTPEPDGMFSLDQRFGTLIIRLHVTITRCIHDIMRLRDADIRWLGR
ncbi:hypothetical protein V2G26_006253 [Clonostachys chloroleuca]